MQSIKVKHNVEMGHRLSLQDSKCNQLHGHSWWVELEIFGEPDAYGMIEDFHRVKKVFREFLDNSFDHLTLVNMDDPLMDLGLPGVVPFPKDPTVENFAEYIGQWAVSQFRINGRTIKVTVWEASTNAATWES